MGKMKFHRFWPLLEKYFLATTGKSTTGPPW